MLYSRKLSQKQNLQVKVFEFVKTPPRIGAIAAAIPNTLETNEIYSGFCFNGTSPPAMASVPEKVPAAPDPATARPRIRMAELGAAAQMMEPISKVAMAATYNHFKLQILYRLPYSACRERSARR